jgi:hypothetical protein
VSTIDFDSILEKVIPIKITQMLFLIVLPFSEGQNRKKRK